MYELQSRGSSPGAHRFLQSFAGGRQAWPASCLESAEESFDYFGRR